MSPTLEERLSAAYVGEGRVGNIIFHVLKRRDCGPGEEACQKIHSSWRSVLSLEPRFLLPSA